MTVKNTTIETKKITDIHGKELLYVVFTSGDKREVINVGQKTYDRITELITNAKKETEDSPEAKQAKQNKGGKL